MVIEENKEYDLKELIGYRPSKTIQTGICDRDTGTIKKIRKVNGKLEYYWDFWDYGWYTKEDLRSDARELADDIYNDLKKLNII